MHIAFLSIVGVILFLVILEKTGLESKFLGKFLAVIVLTTLVMTAFLAIERTVTKSPDKTLQSNISP